MMGRLVYLDNAATTPVDPAVLEEMLPYFSLRFGNPMTAGRSSAGDAASAAIEAARARVAALLGSRPEQVAFTSGGTESDNWALKGALEKAAEERPSGKAHLVTSEFEHPAIVRSVEALLRRGYEATFVKVGREGIVDPDDVRKAMRPDTALVSIMHANNEIGTIQPIADISRIAHERGALMHTDAVQTAAHVPVDVTSLGVDFLSLSSHKFNGPKGVGALYVRDRRTLYPFLDGGDQEGGLRGSTHDVPGIVGLGKAAELAKARLPGEQKRLAALRDRLFSSLSSGIERIAVNGDMRRRLPQNLSLRIDGIVNGPLLMAMNESGIIAAGGCACEAGKAGASHALAAIGCDPREALSAIRFSLGFATTEEDIAYACEIVPRLVRLLRSMS
jgi:cysteine desulfurase